ncbi:M1 family metallopeptidase [Sphingomonas sp.]|jgi:aminopeptidase N|uniref:M1 family metallopeptidase n=1 Tax=Sphingomonas sp. TaxID=28214 RepID=UPI002ED805FC
MILAIFLAAAAPQTAGKPPITPQTQVSGGVRPAEQLALRFDAVDLAIEILPAAKRLRGVATLTFTAETPLSRLLIDLDRNLPVSAVSIDGVALKPAAWSNPDGRLTITLPSPARAGAALVARITYGGVPHVAVNAPWDDGVVWSKTKDGRTWFATTAEGYGCDLFWPCLDFPTGEPGKVDLHITVPKGLKAPSNGVLLGVDALADGRTTWNWRAKRPNTYGVALNVGPYEEVSGTYRSRYGNTVPMIYWHLPGEAQKAKGLFDEFAPTLDFFESVIGPYPFGDEKVGVVETPHKGMEHQTINAYGNAYAKAPEGFDWLFNHEFAHEWFANQLTAANWDDYWLHEGFATYMQPLYGRWREGEARYAVMMEAQRNRIENKAPVVRGMILTEEQVYEPGKGGAGQDIYFKASWMLHTLRWLIGDAAFFDATRRVVYGRPDPKPGNFAPRYGSTAEFERAVIEVTGNDYAWFFDVYLRQAPLPEIVTTRQADGMVEFRWKTSLAKPFPMPVEIAIDGKMRRLEMAGGVERIAIPAGAHVVIDPSSRILRRNPAIEAFQAYQAAQREKP